tara:strand:- start:3670 stop:5034 length:1365 start_codon:yes stop_codon:yes gene_type:complete
MLNLTNDSTRLINQLLDFYSKNNVDFKLPNSRKDIEDFSKFLYSTIKYYDTMIISRNRLSIKKMVLNKKQSLSLYKENRSNYFTNNRYIPYSIIEYIDNNLESLKIYHYNIINRILDYKYNLNVYFVTFKDSKISTKVLDCTINFIVLAFNILNTLTSNNNNNCSKDNTNIFIYLTPVKRVIDSDNITNNHKHVLDEKHANGGFCYGCIKKQNIVIYRREDFYKTLIHELVHNFAIDEPLINNISSDESRKFVKSIFNIDIVSSDDKFNYAINESYTEFWACVLHTAIFSYRNSTRYNDFNTNFYNFLQLEIAHSIVQVQKILTLNNLHYNKMIYHRTNNNITSNYYRENTHVFSYYVLKTLLLYNYCAIITRGDFFSSKFTSNNTFNKKINIIFNLKNIDLFKLYLKKASINRGFVSIINSVQVNFQKEYKTKIIERNNLLIKNMRMVSIEFI